MKEINIKSSTVEKGLDLAKEFLQSVMKPSLDEVGELFADKIKLWRIKNQVRNIEKVKAIVEKEGITTRAINMKVLFPYLDAVALEEDETLQDMWANLFVNYIDSEKNLSLTVYPEILRQLSSREAEVLKYMKNNISELPCELSSLNGYELPIDEIANLERLGLIEMHIIHEMEPIENRYGPINPGKILAEYTHRYYLTDFGFNFIDACTK